jgi:endo-1,4-beta-xylanase
MDSFWDDAGPGRWRPLRRIGMTTMRTRCVVLAALAAMSLSAAPSLAGLKIEAAQAAFKTSGEKIPAYFAKAEDGWVLHKNGEVGDYVSVAQAGEYTLVLRACGSAAKGSWAKSVPWPMVSITVDGRPVGEATIDNEEFKDRPFPIKLGAGVHCVSVSFYNDGPTPADLATEGWKKARNLFVSRLEIVPPAGSAEGAVTLGSQKEWVASNVKQLKAEESLLAAADKEIERIRKGAVQVRVVDANNRPVSGAKVEVELTRHDFLFGCNIMRFDRFRTDAENALYKQRFAELCNYATLGFYWKGYEPERGHPNYADTDKVAAWCQEHGIAMKGHPLLWEQPSGIPSWSPDQPAADLQKQRVTEIIGRFKGRINSWEVVNEPGHSFGGPTAIAVDEPYRWARQADPQAYLNMNDFSVFADGCPKYFDVLKKAVAAGVPFDGIGIQGHDPAGMRFPMAVIQEELDHYATLGKDLSVTELTPPSSGPMLGLTAGGEWDEPSQADYATKLYRTLFAHPAMVAITWWDLTDAGSWRPGAGLLHKDLSPKRVYTALRKLIHEDWHTQAGGQTGDDGRFDLRGFYGQYTVKVTSGGQTVQTIFHLDRKLKDQAWTVAVETKEGK